MMQRITLLYFLTGNSTDIRDIIAPNEVSAEVTAESANLPEVLTFIHDNKGQIIYM